MYSSFRDAPPARQVAAVILLAAAILSAIGAVWYFALRTEYRAVFSSLQPADAASIVAALEKDKIPFRLGDGGATILVPEDKVDSTRVTILGSDLPLKGTVGLELFAKSDMGMTDFAQRINYQRALQGELARTILAIRNVETVRVHLALGEDRVFRADRVPPKASIVVETKDGTPLPAATAQGIQRLVAAAIEQLDPRNVVILDGEGRIVSQAPSTDDGDIEHSPKTDARLAVEAYFAARIRQALADLVPGDEINVSVTAARASDAGHSNDALPDWNIAKRNFRLDITLALPGGVAEDRQEALRKAAGEAIGFDNAKGDSIAFGVWNPGAGSAAAPAEPLRGPAGETSLPGNSAKTSPPALPATAGNWGLLAGGLLAVLGLAALALRRRTGRTGHRDEDTFARRFNTLLKDDLEESKHHAET